MGNELKHLLFAIIVTAALPALALANEPLGAGNTQWKNDGTKTMAALVSEGYEIKAAAGFRQLDVIFLQKKSSVYRCSNEVLVVGGDAYGTCSALVAPYTGPR